MNPILDALNPECRSSIMPQHNPLKLARQFSLRLFIVFTISVLSTLAAGPVDQLRSTLDRETKSLEEILNEPFSNEPLNLGQSKQAKVLLVNLHKKTIAETRLQEIKDRLITIGDKRMPFFMKVFGEKPEGGRSLYISMHGGGGAPKRVNDRQWENQKRLYTLEEGIYVAPRAPTDTWDLWHQSHIDSFFHRLIEDLVAIENVNPDRVYIMGYSAGGDGVFQLAPRMADYLAAAAMMAGHPNETSPLGFRNLPFILQMGGRDSAYNRNKVAAEWEAKLAALREKDPAGYTHQVKIYTEYGHWMNGEDAIAIPWMHKFNRKKYPGRIVWKQDDVTHARFYWLAQDPEGYVERSAVVVSRKGQVIRIEKTDVPKLKIRLNDAMVDLDQPVSVYFQDKLLFEGKVDRSIRMQALSLIERADPSYVFSAEITVSLP